MEINVSKMKSRPKVLAHLALIMLLTCADAKPPVIHEDGSVTFYLYAPEASQVEIDVKGRTNRENNGQPFPMTRGDDGQWTFTSAPLDPGFHYYLLFIDGAKIADNSNPLYFGWGRPTNGLEIPDPNLDIYLPRRVPRGEIRSLPYFSETTQSWREARVYTPPQYDAQPRKRFPTLYLQHGAGENHTSWGNQGRAGTIMDNLIADGKCLPMIVVMENGYAYAPDAEVDESGRRINSFEKVIFSETIPLIEKRYRVVADKDRRAIAGLSMGGGQSMRAVLENLDTFSYLGSFSGAPRETGGLIKDPQRVNDSLRLYWIGCGTEDFAYERSQNVHRELEALGVTHEFFSHPGTHEWQAWRLHLSVFAPKLFRD